MKTVYVMWNYDEDEVMFASEDKELVQEMMYDFMMEDIQLNYGLEYHMRNYVLRCPVEDIINNIWDLYINDVTILEIPVVN